MTLINSQGGSIIMKKILMLFVAVGLSVVASEGTLDCAGGTLADAIAAFRVRAVGGVINKAAVDLVLVADFHIKVHGLACARADRNLLSRGRVSGGGVRGIRVVINPRCRRI